MVKNTDKSSKNIINNSKNTENVSRLIEIQYQSFTDNERRREATVLQFVVIIVSIIATLGLILRADDHIHELLLLFCFISLPVLLWLGEYILNSSYQLRCGQAIQSIIRRKHNNLYKVIPESWDIFIDKKRYGKTKKRDLLTNYYRAHLNIIYSFMCFVGFLPLYYWIYFDNKLQFFKYIIIFSGNIFIILMMIGFIAFLKNRVEYYNEKLRNMVLLSFSC